MLSKVLSSMLDGHGTINKKTAISENVIVSVFSTHSQVASGEVIPPLEKSEVKCSLNYQGGLVSLS